MKIKSMAAATLAGWCVAGAALASSPYPDASADVMNPATYTFVAQSSGDVVATLISADAAYDEYLGLSQTGVSGLLNHGTVGSTLDLGAVTKGEVLTFYIYVINSNTTYSSDSALNTSDGESNHVYATPVGDDMLLAFEDLPKGGTDWDYNDAVYTVSNVAVVPEPANLALLMAGLGLVGFMARRRRG